MGSKQKILKDVLTNKQRILRMIERWDDDISFDQALYHMYVMKEVMEGIRSAEEGDTIDHDELFDELEQLCDKEENQARLVEKSRKESKGTPPTNIRRQRPQNGKVLRNPVQRPR